MQVDLYKVKLDLLGTGNTFFQRLLHGFCKPICLTSVKHVAFVFFHMSLAILAYGLFSKAGDWLILPFFKGVAPNIVKPFFEGLWVVTAGLTFFKGVACVTPLLDTILLSRLRLLLC